MGGGSDMGAVSAAWAEFWDGRGLWRVGGVQREGGPRWAEPPPRCSGVGGVAGKMAATKRVLYVGEWRGRGCRGGSGLSGGAR